MMFLPDLVSLPLIDQSAAPADQDALARWERADLADPTRRPQLDGLPIEPVRGYDPSDDSRMKASARIDRIEY
jgi:hypothetical protein